MSTTSSSCESCDRAAHNPRTGLYSRGCPHCQARALSHSHAFFDSHHAGRLTKDYRAALESIRRSDEPLDAVHARVRLWHSRITAAEQ